MKIIDIQQNTEEWLELRRRKIGASDCPIIMRVSPYKNPLQLWNEKVQGISSPQSVAMTRGHHLEKGARKWIEALHQCSYEPLCVESSEYPWMIASLDGYDPKSNTVIEIKCPNAEIFKAIKLGQIPDHYLWQIQHQLSVTNSEKALLVTWNEREGIISPILRSKEMIKDLIETELRFYERMMNLEPPEEANIENQRTDQEFLEAEKELYEIMKQREQLEELEKIHRDSLIYLAGNESCKGKFFFVEKCPGKKSIDYRKIPEIKNLDLTPYEKQGASYWKIRESR